MEHTFQQGDRVVDTIDGAKGTVNRRNEHGHWLVLRDDRLAYSWSPYFSCREDVLRHDTDLRKGDWVRHDAISNKCQEKRFDGGPYQVSEVRQDLVEVTEATKHKDNESRYLYKENIVKIQPPQEGAMPPYHIGIENTEEDTIERGIQEKIRLLERQVEKAKCCLKTYRDLKQFIAQGKGT